MGDMENKRSSLARALNTSDALPDFNPEWLTRSPRLRADASVFAERTNRMPYYAAAAAVLFALLGTSLYLRSPAPAAQVASRGLVISVAGPTQVQRGEATTDLYNGDMITEGDRITTGKDARVEIALAGHSVRILENSSVTLLELKKTSEGQRNVGLDVAQGTLLSSVKRLSKQESFEVRTPVAIAGVRGTRFSVAVNDSGSQVRLYDGAVVVKRGESETVLSPGKGVEVTKSGVSELTEDSTDYAQQIQEMETNPNADPEIIAAADSLKSAKSEKELKALYQKIEIIRLRDGRVIRGVIAQQVGSRVVIHTSTGKHVVQSSEIEDQSFAEEP